MLCWYQTALNYLQASPTFSFLYRNKRFQMQHFYNEPMFMFKAKKKYQSTIKKCLKLMFSEYWKSKKCSNISNTWYWYSCTEKKVY